MNKDSRGFNKRLNSLRKRKDFKALVDELPNNKKKDILVALLDYIKALEDEIEMIRDDISR